VSQFPSSEMEPTTLIVCSTTVVTTSLNVTATLDAAVQDVLVVNVESVVVLVPNATTVLELDTEDEGDDEAPLGPVIAISAQVR
jgi:hypothetical protein